MKVTVLGLGYVGSVAAAGFAAAGHDVVGIDVDREKINSYRNGQIPFYEPGLADLIGICLHQNKLRFLHTSEALDPLGEVIVLAMGTPASPSGAADLSQVEAALSWIKSRQRGGAVIMMKSTVPPGTGVALSETMLSNTTFKYVSNPEFLREGQAVFDWFHPDRLIIGAACDSAIETVKELYRDVDAPCLVSDITSAEMIKYAANSFLATKISFINDIAGLCDRLNASVDHVTKGIGSDPRIGSAFLQAGVGYGGSCFPKDVRALNYLALSNGHHSELLPAVIRINDRQRLLPLQAMHELFGSLKGVTIGVLGLAFKPHTDDMREAPSADLIHLLLEEGAILSAYDPKAVPVAANLLPEEVWLTDDLLECTMNAQALVLMTEWPEIVSANWAQIAENMQHPSFLFDGRNALNPERMRDLGFLYCGVGRGTRQPLEARTDARLLAVA